ETYANFVVFTEPPDSNNIEIDHLQFRETGTVHGNKLGKGAIYINPAGTGPPVSHISIHDNQFHCASTSCITADFLVDSSIRSNTFDNDGTGEHGVYLSSTSEYYSERVVVDSNTFHS